MTQAHLIVIKNAVIFIPDSRFPIPDSSQLQRSLIQSHRSEFQR
ncbi:MULTISPECIES: hypothetical protein [unclassified Moorena]|nr:MULTISPECIES: hypothetical protein [unclassified Moorena]